MSGYPVTQNTAAKLYFLMYDSAQTLPVGKADLVVGNITVTIKKLGGAWEAASGAITNEGEGWYSVAHVANTDTAGPLLLKAIAAGAVTALQTFNVVAYNSADAEDLGLSSITAAAAQATAAADFAEANNTMLGTVPADVWDHNFSGDTAANWLLGTNNLAVILEARLTLNAIRDAIWQAATSALTTTGSIGLFIVNLASGAAGSPVLRSFFSSFITTDRMNTLTDLGTMIDSDSTPDAKFSPAALENAPSGGGGGGTTRVYVFGPLGITALSGSLDGRIQTFLEDEVEALFQLKDATGQVIPYSSGDTVTFALVDAAGTAQTAPTATKTTPDRGEIRCAFTAPDTAGLYRLTVAVNSTTFGPYAVEVKTP